MKTDELDFPLPSELIAQTPTADRAASRLLVFRRSDRSVEHRHFSDLPSILRAGDLLVFNDTKVVPARVALQKSTGGLAQGLFLEELAPGRWRMLLRNVAAGSLLSLVQDPSIALRPVERDAEGQFIVRVDPPVGAAELLARVGRMPLPPYIKRGKSHDERDDLDRQRYQTIYAAREGAVAAPTAGLHFTPELLDQLDRTGVERTFVTLHVGLGTFRPIAAASLEQHTMHSERYEIGQGAAEAINRARNQGRRVVAVGTTVARVIESQPPGQPIGPRLDQTAIFIRPPYLWRHVDALITNFHLPRSTLIALVAAMVGLDEQKRLYRLAVDQRYRFFSYGDAMLIE
jgi:S-adenosylmethionine:tRNA ribosyltransferase-isomerase